MTLDLSGLLHENHLEDPGSRRSHRSRRLTRLTDEMLTATAGWRPKFS